MSGAKDAPIKFETQINVLPFGEILVHNPPIVSPVIPHINTKKTTNSRFFPLPPK